MPRFSYSKISTFDTCRLQYKFNYIDRIRVEKETTAEAFLGSMVHDALEKLYKDIRFEKRMSEIELLAYYNQIWKKNWSKAVQIVKKEYSEENYRKMGERYLIDYYKHHTPFTEGTILGLETQEMMSLDPEGKYKYDIRIDRLMDRGGGLYEVHDYKSGMSLPKQEDLDQDRQLAMYGLWVCERFKDCKKVRLVWHYLAFDKELESYRTLKQLQDLRREIKASIKVIESAEDFPPKVTYLCRWCLFQEVCPAWKHEKKIEQLPENRYLDDPGVKLVDEYVKTKVSYEKGKKEADEKLNMLKEALIAFCKKEDVTVVTGSKNKVLLKEEETFKLPGKNTPERTELKQLLEKIGKIEEVLDLDVHSLQSMIKNKQWEEGILKKLARFENREIIYKLSVRKK